jgi:hypothetical protein
VRRLVLIGAALPLLTVAGLALHSPGDLGVGTPARKDAFVALLALAAALYLYAVSLVWRRELPPRTVWLVLGVAALMRVCVLFAPPILSTDVYRYVWDGRVQAAGINPYLYVPSDPALAALRDDTVYPRINRVDTARTIYAPAAEIVFAAIGYVAPGVLATKAAMAGFEALAVVCLWRLLGMARLPVSRVLIYAWNPLVVWAFAGNGHVDAMAIGLLALAMLARARGRDGLAGAVFAACVLVKFLPVVVAPALWRGRWRFAAAAALATVALYACYLGAGRQILGFLPDYPAEEGLDTGRGFWLLAGLAHLTGSPGFPPKLYMAVCAIGVAALGLWIVRTRRPPLGSPGDVRSFSGQAAALMAAATVAISPHYPWYFCWLALPCVLCPSRALLWLGVSPVLLYIDPFDETFFWPSLVYAPALLLAVLDTVRPWPTTGRAISSGALSIAEGSMSGLSAGARTTGALSAAKGTTAALYAGASLAGAPLADAPAAGDEATTEGSYR